MADIRPTPEQRPVVGGLARLLQRADKFARAPFGYENPPAAMLSDFLSIPPLYRTMENYAYGSPLASGTSSVSRYLPRLSEDTKGAIEGAINLAPMVGPAARATTAGATALGRLGERAAARAVPQIMERRGVGADLLSALASGTTSNVVKPKGGNWLAGDIEWALKPLRSIVVGEEPAERLKKLENYFADARAKGIALDYSVMDRERARMAPDVAINRWIDTKLNKYIRNEMATPEDPVRALAEQGVTHLPMDLIGNVDVLPMGKLGLARTKGGFPAEGMGQSPAARAWEYSADSSIKPRTAGSAAQYEFNVEDMPWLKKLDPETPVYGIPSASSDDLGFRHIIDELKAAMSPTSELPQHLRLDPKDIDKVTMPQAVERVSKINAWRAEQAAQAEKAGMMENLQATPRLADENLQLSFVEKPGGAWVDIPETLNEKGIQLCTSIGKAGGWCTKNEGLARTYGSGENRLATLLDAEGRPHAQAKITTDADHLAAFEAATETLTPQQVARWEDDMARIMDRPPELEEGLDWMAHNAPEAYLAYKKNLADQGKNSLPDITELKPPGNTFNSDRAREYAKRDPDYKAKVTGSVLNFLNSGEWGRVADLHHYDIVDLQRDSTMLQAYLGDILPHKLPFERKDLFNAAIDANPNLPRFMTPQQLRDLVRSVKPPGYAEGGYVQGYGVGGAVKSFAKLVRSYLASEGKVAEAVAEAAPKEQKMLMGVYRGYAGDNPSPLVHYHGGTYKPGDPVTQPLYLSRDADLARSYAEVKGGELVKVDPRPRKTASQKILDELAAEYVPENARSGYTPASALDAAMHGERAVNRLQYELSRNPRFYDSARGMDVGFPSLTRAAPEGEALIMLPGSQVRAVPDVELFATPQRRVADYYAQKRAAQTGQAPHLEMVLVDPFAGEQYGHSTLGTGKNPPMITRARKLKPEDVVDRTQLYAKGGAVDYDPDEIARLAASVVPGYAAGGLVDYDPTEIDTIVSKLKEEFHG